MVFTKKNSIHGGFPGPGLKNTEPDDITLGINNNSMDNPDYKQVYFNWELLEKKANIITFILGNMSKFSIYKTRRKSTQSYININSPLARTVA